MKNLSLVAIILSLGSIAFAQGATSDSKAVNTTNKDTKQTVVVNPVTKPAVPETTEKGEKVGNYFKPIQLVPGFHDKNSPTK